MPPSNRLTGTLRSGVRCRPSRVCARSATGDRRRAVECKPGITTKRCHTAVVVTVGFGHGAVRGRVGVRARALRGGAGTAGCGAVPGDGASVSGVARACTAGDEVRICNTTRGHCQIAGVCACVGVLQYKQLRNGQPQIGTSTLRPTRRLSATITDGFVEVYAF